MNWLCSLLALLRPCFLVSESRKTRESLTLGTTILFKSCYQHAVGTVYSVRQHAWAYLVWYEAEARFALPTRFL